MEELTNNQKFCDGLYTNAKLQEQWNNDYFIV